MPKKNLVIYHVDRFYDKNDNQYYDVLPYSFRGHLLTYFGFDFSVMRWYFQYSPWYLRFTEPVRWFANAHFSKARAESHAEKLNARIKESTKDNDA